MATNHIAIARMAVQKASRERQQHEEEEGEQDDKVSLAESLSSPLGRLATVEDIDECANQDLCQLTTLTSLELR